MPKPKKDGKKSIQNMKQKKAKQQQQQQTNIKINIGDKGKTTRRQPRRKSNPKPKQSQPPRPPQPPSYPIPIPYPQYIPMYLANQPLTSLTSTQQQQLQPTAFSLVDRPVLQRQSNSDYITATAIAEPYPYPTYNRSFYEEPIPNQFEDANKGKYANVYPAGYNQLADEQEAQLNKIRQERRELENFDIPIPPDDSEIKRIPLEELKKKDERLKSRYEAMQTADEILNELIDQSTQMSSDDNTSMELLPKQELPEPKLKKKPITVKIEEEEDEDDFEDSKDDVEPPKPEPEPELKKLSNRSVQVPPVETIGSLDESAYFKRISGSKATNKNKYLYPERNEQMRNKSQVQLIADLKKHIEERELFKKSAERYLREANGDTEIENFYKKVIKFYDDYINEFSNILDKKMKDLNVRK